MSVMSIQIEKITSRDALAGLESEWNALLQRSASDTITLTHQWLSTWWDTFGENRELLVLLAREGEKLVGIAPLLRRRVRRFGVPLRRLEFLASGEAEADEICSDYLDFILEAGREREVLGLMIEFLGRDSGWDELILTDIAGESPNVELLREIGATRGLSFEITRDQTCIFVPLPGSRDELMRTISSQKRKRLNKDRRTFAACEMRVQKFDGPNEFDAAFEILVRLHQERWTARGFPGSFSSAKFLRFHRELASKIVPCGWLKIWVMWQEDAPLCAVYDFFYAGKIFHYQSGMSARPTPLISPGMLIWDFALEDAIAGGLSECDFLKGEVGGYKTSWGGQTRPILQLRLARGGPRERLFQGVARIVNQLRPVRGRLRKRAARVRSHWTKRGTTTTGTKPLI